MNKFMILVVLLLSGCTGNQWAKTYGGTETITVPKGQKVFDVTWKGEDIWYATRPFREGEVPETSTFRAKTNFGILEGSVIFEESN